MLPNAGSSRASFLAGLISALALTACHSGRSTVFPAPLSTSPAASQRDLGQRFDQVYPSAASGSRVAGLLAPRFGLPSFTTTAARFELALLARQPGVALRAALAAPSLDEASARACLDAAAADRCVPLVIGPVAAKPVKDSEFIELTAPASAAAVPVGAWDLVVQAAADPPERVHRSVWIESADPSAVAPLRVVHLSDLHLGKKAEILSGDGLVTELRTIIQRINTVKPNLVVLTGDVAEDGQEAAWLQRAHELLLALEAPLVVIPGNHDFAHFPKIRNPRVPPDGWWNFAREFHSRRRIELSYHGWDFLGFDSGPSVFSIRVLTRGVDEETLGWLSSRVDEAAKQRRKGVVFFSHAPTRTAPIQAPDVEVQGLCGHMHQGGHDIEKILEAGVGKQLNMVYLSGHTHWLELYELRPQSERIKDHWQRWPDGVFEGDSKSGALMVNIPAATRVTFRSVRRGRRSGFGVLTLDGAQPSIDTWLCEKDERDGRDGVCQEPKK